MKKGKVVKIVVFLILGLGLVAGGLFLAKNLLSKKNSENVTYRVNKEKYENVIEISGTVAAAQEQTLQALSAGTVLAVYVKAGDHVKKGDIILQLDDTTEQYNLAKHDYDMTTTKITGSAKQLKLMETQRLSLVQKIADRKVLATFDGVIADLDVAVGDSLEAKDKVGTLVNVEYLTAEVEIPETDVSKLKVGQKVNFTFPALSNQTIEGYVTGWPAIGEITSRGATIVNAKVRIDDYPEQILPNFSFTGKIELSPTTENLVVSKYAIGYENREPYVVIARTGEKKSVKVQPYGKEYVKILDGLQGNEVLQQLTVPKSSGTNKNRNNTPGGMPGGQPPAGGFSGSAPAGFGGGTR